MTAVDSEYQRLKDVAKIAQYRTEAKSKGAHAPRPACRIVRSIAIQPPVGAHSNWPKQEMLQRKRLGCVFFECMRAQGTSCAWFR